MKQNKKDKGVIIQNNSLTGVIWDGQAIAAINTVAHALYNLTEIFKSQNIHIEMIKINDGELNIGEK